ncbi:MAG: hypothetical protein KAV40_02265 [Thermoplasmatales archaeon]|nr:hypothetical protein [Thermoplasmatales archaeon]
MIKKGLSLIIIISVVISIMPPFTTQGETTSIKNDAIINDGSFEMSSKSSIMSDDSGYQDGRFISKLHWFSPNGELPGTYEEYLSKHPLTPAQFSTPGDGIDPPEHLENSISILVDAGLHLKITVALNQYIDDLEAEGHPVFLQTVLGGTPEEIKERITQRYNSGSTGIVLVGDITAAWAEVSGSVFPCDLFYMDLDGNWEDNDLDGVYEIHTAGDGDMGPEVYVGRIYAYTLTYDTEATMVNEYLAKVHAYRSDELEQPWRGLEYVDEDWYDMDVHLDLIYGNDVARHDYGYFTTGEDYLDQMDLGQHFVQVCAHSYSGGHHFGRRPTESASYAHIYVYSPASRSAKLLLGSDDGIKIWLNGDNVYTNDRYGSWHQDAYEVDVTLNEGWNQMLCKISQRGGDYKFSAHFTDTNYITFDDLDYQINDPESHSGEAEFIRSWLLNGFHQDVSGNFWDYLTTNYLGVNEASVNPDDGDIMGGKTWTTYDSGNPYIDMADYCNNADFGVCYAFVRVNADVGTSCQLWMGYDDGARAWLNGAEVLYDNRYGGFEADMAKVNVTLQSGENRLLVKISEWMGSHGFSARFCLPNGSAVEGLTYDPEPTPIAHIGTWLVNGPYTNPDQATRLSTDYLGDEANVTPSEGDPAPFGNWERGIGNGCPFDIGVFFDHGDWVLSEDVQNRDPPVLFYNLFACGPGRFTDENYLAGAYIFHTTYGLITIASSKSGSMLNFDDFTGPLSERKSIGEAFCEWFDAQAPFVQWEKEWYYGMVVCGDPTLSLNLKTQMKITKPEKAIYIRDNKVLPFFLPILIGKITIEANATNEEYGINRVEFLVDNDLKENDSSEPYSFSWNEPAFFRHNIKVVAYDNIGKSISKEIIVWKFF